MIKIEQNQVFWPLILILWVGPQIFPNRAPAFVNPDLVLLG